MKKNEWRTYLQSQQAQFCEQNTLLIDSFSAQDRQSSAFVTPLLYQGVLSVDGPDSAKFLQGQLTCDTSAVNPQQSILGAACSPQGRMFSSFRLFQKHDESGYLLRMSSDLVDSTRETIHKYSVFFKTELNNAEDEWLGLGIWGSECEALIRQAFNIEELPEQKDQVVSNESILLTRLAGTTPRYECWIKSTDITENWDTLTQQAQLASTHLWRQQDIEAGIAELSQAIEGEFNPHMLNFQHIDAVSFDKGCYTGQEIVARTHYRGNSKRLVKRFSLSGGPLLPTGTELLAPDSDKNLATVISAAPLGDQKDTQQALLVVSAKLDTSNALTLCQNNQQYQAIEQPLPYDLD